jgi:hypothetical protein
MLINDCTMSFDREKCDQYTHPIPDKVLFIHHSWSEGCAHAQDRLVSPYNQPDKEFCEDHLEDNTVTCWHKIPQMIEPEKAKIVMRRENEGTLTSGIKLRWCNNTESTIEEMLRQTRAEVSLDLSSGVATTQERDRFLGKDRYEEYREECKQGHNHGILMNWSQAMINPLKARMVRNSTPYCHKEYSDYLPSRQVDGDW